MIRILHHTQRNLVAYVALFAALGGTSYAASAFPGHGAAASRGQLPTAGRVVAWAHVTAAGKVIGGSRGAKAQRSYAPPTLISYEVRWRGISVPERCAAMVTLANSGANGPLGFARANVSAGGSRPHDVQVGIYSASGQPIAAPFFISVLC